MAMGTRDVTAPPHPFESVQEASKHGFQRDNSVSQFMNLYQAFAAKNAPPPTVHNTAKSEPPALKRPKLATPPSYKAQVIP